MTVHAIEQYFVTKENLNLDKQLKVQILKYLESMNCRKYEFSDSDSSLIVDDFESRIEAEEVNIGLDWVIKNGWKPILSKREPMREA